jgi:hypothetical protein
MQCPKKIHPAGISSIDIVKNSVLSRDTFAGSGKGLISMQVKKCIAINCCPDPAKIPPEYPVFFVIFQRRGVCGVELSF